MSKWFLMALVAAMFSGTVVIADEPKKEEPKKEEPKKEEPKKEEKKEEKK